MPADAYSAGDVITSPPPPPMDPQRAIAVHQLKAISGNWREKRGASVLMRRGGEEFTKKGMPGGQWRSRLCRCHDDVGTCCVVCWCSCVVAPQLFERENGPPGTCRKWFLRLGGLCTAACIVVGVRNLLRLLTFDFTDCVDYSAGTDCYFTVYDLAFGACALCLLCAMLAIQVFLLRAARARVREADLISAGPLGERAEDCCVACCCTCCLQCQLLRHLGLTWGRPLCCARRRRRYQLASSTGEYKAGAAVDAV